MQLIRYQPWRAFDLVDRLLADSQAHFAGDHTVAADWVPAVDIKEEAGRFVIHADLPGVNPQDVEITMEDGVLTLAGERKAETRDEKDGWQRVERLHGRFLRRFTLPEGTDAEGVSATGSNGVLEITIPKAVKAQPKKITVKAA